MAASLQQVALLKGLGIHVADINVQSGADVPITNLHPGAPFQIGDTIVDNAGDMYTVTAVAADKITVSQAIQGVSLKGPKGDAGQGLLLKGSFPSVDQLPADNNKPGDAYLVQGSLHVWDGAHWVDGGNIQGPSGEGFHTVNRILADDAKVPLADLVPNSGVTVGDSVVDSNGDVRPINATSDTEATLGKKTINLKGGKGDKGDNGDPGQAGVNGASYRVAKAALADGKLGLDQIVPAGVVVDDTVLLQDGTVGTVTAVADGKATITLVNGVNLKGGKGDKGETGVKSATATALASDAAPTATVDDKGVLALGIPAGAKGDKGDNGQRGTQIYTSPDDTIPAGAQNGDWHFNTATSVLSVIQNA